MTNKTPPARENVLTVRCEYPNFFTDPAAWAEYEADQRRFIAQLDAMAERAWERRVERLVRDEPLP